MRLHDLFFVIDLRVEFGISVTLFQLDEVIPLLSSSLKELESNLLNEHNCEATKQNLLSRSSLLVSFRPMDKFREAGQI